MTIITIKQTGEVQWIGDAMPIPVTIVERKRLSTIEPFDTVKRDAFRLLRFMFGEQGRVAAWTRKWRGLWLVTILETGEWSVFRKRANAVRWELEKLAL